MIIYICCTFFRMYIFCLFAGSHPAIFDRVESMLCCVIVMWCSSRICWMNLEEKQALDFLIAYAILQLSKVNLS